MRQRRRAQFVTFPLRCRHGISSGSPCWRCGDVVPTLDGRRPWWVPLWRAWRAVAGVIGL